MNLSGQPEIGTQVVPRAGGFDPRNRKPIVLTASEMSIAPSPLKSMSARSPGPGSAAGEK
jgi:hypothetical protein